MYSSLKIIWKFRKYRVVFFALICHTREFFTQMEIQMASNFDLCTTLMVIKYRGFFNVPYLLRHGIPVFMISPRTGDSHICCQVLAWYWSCDYLLKRLRFVILGIKSRSVATMVRTPIYPMRGERSTNR